MEVDILGADARDRVDTARATVAELLPQIPELTAFALANAPADWRSHYIDGEGATRYTGLWSMGLDFDEDGSLRLGYDYGDLGMIVQTIHDDGRREVTRED
jgi:hypothetical protein